MSIEEDSNYLSIEQLELARQILHLEKKIDAFERINEDEIEQLRNMLDLCKTKILKILEDQSKDTQKSLGSNNQ